MLSCAPLLTVRTPHPRSHRPFTASSHYYRSLGRRHGIPRQDLGLVNHHDLSQALLRISQRVIEQK